MCIFKETKNGIKMTIRLGRAERVERAQTLNTDLGVQGHMENSQIVGSLILHLWSHNAMYF